MRTPHPTHARSAHVGNFGVRPATPRLGKLLICPFCVSLWIATGFAIGVVFAPRFTRFVAATFSVVAGSDFLQLVYSALQSAET